MKNKYNEVKYCDNCEVEITSMEYDENKCLCNDCKSKEEKENILSLSEINQTMFMLRRIIDYKNATPKVIESIQIISEFLMESMFEK